MSKVQITLPSDEQIDKHNTKKNTPTTIQNDNTIVLPSNQIIENYSEELEDKKTPPPLIQQQDIVQAEQPEEQYSVKDLETDDQFFEDILQYREDRFGVAKDKGTYNFITGAFLGDTQELTNENLVDDYLDHYRGVTNNSVYATSEINWLRSVKAKEDAILGDRDYKDLSTEEIDEVNNLREQRGRALRIYKKADNLAGFFGKKRYENMDFFEKVGDVTKTTGVVIAHSIGDPISAFTVGVGKLFGMAASQAGLTPIKSALFAAATTAPLEAGASAMLDIQVQKAEIEMGAREEIDMKRVATVASISAATSGILSYAGTKSSVKRVDKANRQHITNALKKITKEQVDKANATNKKLGIESDTIRENLAKGIEDVYGADAILRNKEGEITGLNSKLIRESDEATALKKDLGLDELEVEESFNFGTFDRVAATLGEILEEARAGNIKLNTQSKKYSEDFISPLQKNEMVSERLLNILSHTNEESMGFVSEIMGKYGITQRELAATMFADASWAGKRLNALSQLSKKFGHAGRQRTAQEIAEGEAPENAVLGPLFTRLESIRRLTLVSGIATAVRNNISQVIRSGTDTLIYGLESGIHTVLGTGRKRFGLKNTLRQLEHTFYDSKDADTVAKLMLDVFDNQKARYYNNYSEIKMNLAKNNPGQSSTAGIKNGVASESPILDKWENAVHVANSLNRYQEFLYRNGMFTASLQRQVFDKGGDFFEILNSGRIKENINEDMIAKAVDDALDFTYASQPKFYPFRVLNNFIVQSGLTLAIPFPRFMMKAMEMTYNYNITGVATGLGRMLYSKAIGQNISDGSIRQLSEGIAGGIPLLYLGYYLRDREGDHAGSEWYKLKDNLGNEFDARPFFPLTPYLLLGEYFHRVQEERAGATIKFYEEALPGFTGANFRGSGVIGKMAEDTVSVIATKNDDVAFQKTAKQVGQYLGEIASGYGQPIWQVADMFSTSDQRMKYYKDDPEYREGIAGFFTTLGKGFIEPFESRLKRVGEAVGFDYDEPYREDPRFKDVPERVMPFMKILFGATLTRVPPKYVSELNTYGFNYVNFMSKTNSVTLDRRLNRQMGISMQTEMPELLATLNEEYPVGDGEGYYSLKASNAIKAQEIKNYISILKSSLYTEMKPANEDTILQSSLGQFRKLGPYGRAASIEAFKKVFERNPNFNDESDVGELLQLGKNNFKVMAKQRN